jgi:hypothetical protein
VPPTELLNVESTSLPTKQGCESDGHSLKQMSYSLYSLKIQTLAVHFEGGASRVVYIPAGALIRINGDSGVNPNLVEVVWQGKTVHAFRQDILERSRAFQVVATAAA